jgi:hypothetical protein
MLGNDNLFMNHAAWQTLSWNANDLVMSGKERFINVNLNIILRRTVWDVHMLC